MALVTENPRAVFELAEIGRGHLLWGRHRSWNEGKAGFVTAATEDQLIVQYYPVIGNVTNHFIIPVSEVVDGQWEIRWSADMTEIKGYGLEPVGDGDQQEKEGAGDNDAGGIDL